jgi:hypothetical protein
MFLRHVGKQGDRKVAVVFREVPGDDHLALVVFTELLGQNIHDPMMRCIESDIGQNSESLADALNRAYTKDGRQILQVLHQEGMLKRVSCESIIMTPQPGVSIKLNELNKILNEMKQGEEAVKKLAELDASRGMQDPADVARRMRGESKKEAAPVVASGDALGDAALANNLRQQAARMSAEAKGLLAEAARLEQEAASLDPVKATTAKPKKSVRAKTKTTA